MFEYKNGCLNTYSVTNEILTKVIKMPVLIILFIFSWHTITSLDNVFKIFFI